MTNLTLDIGNTRIKSGLFQENNLREQAIWNRDTLAALPTYCRDHRVQQIIVSAVTAVEMEAVAQLAADFSVVVLTHETPLPFENHYKTPQTLGKDRVAGVAGVQALFPGENGLVIDGGTCIKYDLFLADGGYRGGNIAPGLHMRIQAMHHFTARLPEVPMSMPQQVIGDTTETALQNGALRGAILEIQGFIRIMNPDNAPLRIILTGGDAGFIGKYLNYPDQIIEPNLTLFGLNHILQFNTGKV